MTINFLPNVPFQVKTTDDAMQFAQLRAFLDANYPGQWWTESTGLLPAGQISIYGFYQGYPEVKHKPVPETVQE